MEREILSRNFDQKGHKNFVIKLEALNKLSRRNGQKLIRFFGRACFWAKIVGKQGDF